MEIIKGKNITKSYEGEHLAEKNNFYLIADFMLGDADSYKKVSQAVFKKLNKSLKNYILKLETLKGTCVEDIETTDEHIMGSYFDTPFTEFGYWVFEDFKIVFLDKNNEIIKCKIEYNDNEKAILESWRV